MNPLLIAGASALAMTTYFLLTREEKEADFSDCYDANLPPDIKAELEKMFRPETGEATITRLLERAKSYRNVAKILKGLYPKAHACSVRRAAQLEEVIRTASKLAKEKALRPKKGAAAPPPTVTEKEAAPTPTKKEPVPLAPGKTATFGAFKLPAKNSPERDARVLKLVKEGRFREVDWKPVDCSRDGIDCTVMVSADALALGDETNFVRANVRHDTAEKLAMLLNAHLPTTRIMDLEFQQADTVLRPHPVKAGPQMSDTSAMYEHSIRVEKERAGRGGLVRPVGKGWVTSNYIFGQQNKHAPENTGVNFGWHTKGPAKYKSPGGRNVLQPLSTAHGVAHTDYSQVVYFVRGDAIVNGQPMALADLLKHPTLSKTVSDEGPLQRTRHPSQPDAGAAPVLAVV